MSRKFLFAPVMKTWVAAGVAIVVITLSATATPASAGSTETSFAFAVQDDQSSEPAEWPSFTDALNETPAPPTFASFDATPGVLGTTMVSAPLPPAVFTGLFMLAGNCVLTHLWKKRKI